VIERYLQNYTKG